MRLSSVLARCTAAEFNMQITVVYSPVARNVLEVLIPLDAPTTVQESIRRSGFLEQFSELDLASLEVGVWGRKSALDHLLRDYDRVEIYRRLTVDPKVARRERFAKQGARTAGLFNKKRPGSAAGY